MHFSYVDRIGWEATLMNGAQTKTYLPQKKVVLSAGAAGVLTSY